MNVKDCQCLYWARTWPNNTWGHHRNCEHYNPIRVYKVRPGFGFNPVWEKDLQEILPWLEDAQVGDVVRVAVYEMTPEDYEALSEYMGP